MSETTLAARIAVAEEAKRKAALALKELRNEYEDKAGIIGRTVLTQIDAERVSGISPFMRTFIDWLDRSIGNQDERQKLALAELVKLAAKPDAAAKLSSLGKIG